MCKLSETNIHWCWRYSSRRTKFSNILSIWANKNGDKSAILYLILTKLNRIHERIVVNSCVKNQDYIHPDRQYFQIFCQFEQTKMAIHVYRIEKKCSLVLEIFIRTDNMFKYFVNLSKQKWQLVGHYEFYPDETSQDSLEDGC